MDLASGPTSKIYSIPASQTSYPHRAALLKFQFYDDAGTNSTDVYPSDGFDFLNGWVSAIENAMSGTTLGMYYNYADPTLGATEAHERYWLDNYNGLMSVKEVWDKKKVFENPQAVLST